METFKLAMIVVAWAGLGLMSASILESQRWLTWVLAVIGGPFAVPVCLAVEIKRERQTEESAADQGDATDPLGGLTGTGTATGAATAFTVQPTPVAAVGPADKIAERLSATTVLAGHEACAP
jgi:hypothetical protein